MRTNYSAGETVKDEVLGTNADLSGNIHTMQMMYPSARSSQDLVPILRGSYVELTVGQPYGACNRVPYFPQLLSADRYGFLEPW